MASFGDFVGGAESVLGLFTSPITAVTGSLGGVTSSPLGGLGGATGDSPLGMLGGSGAAGAPGEDATSASGEGIPNQQVGQGLIPGISNLVGSLGGVVSGVPVVGPIANSLMEAIFGRGNTMPNMPVGKARYVTVVLGVYDNGFIREERFPGKPYLMNKDIVAAKKVFKQSSKLQKRMPRKTVKESSVTKLKNAAVDESLRRITGGGDHCHNPCG